MSETMIERADAVRLGLGRYFTGLECKNGHVCERNTKNRECIGCSVDRARKDPNKAARTKASCIRNSAKRTADQAHRYWSDVEKARAYQIEHRIKNIERFVARELEQRVKHAEKRRQYAVRRYEENPEAIKEASRKWAKSNLAKIAARTARRKAAKLKATPVWADHQKIQEFYELARALTAETGIPHEVDHIHPLQGELVCGLHVHTNLQVITKSANSMKKNKFIPAIDAALKEPKP